MAKHQASVWVVCPVCDGGVPPEDMLEGDRELLAALRMDHLVAADGEILGDCGCYSGVLIAPDAAMAERMASRYLPRSAVRHAA